MCAVGEPLRFVGHEIRADRSSFHLGEFAFIRPFIRSFSENTRVGEGKLSTERRDGGSV